MKFDNVLMKCVQADLKAGLTPMLLGEPGIGKSSWVCDLGRLLHTKVFIVACNQLADKADLTGARLVPTEDGKSYYQYFYPHSTISNAIAYAIDNPKQTPILFLDELNRTTPDVTSAALSIPTQRAIGSVELPKNLRVMIAGNDKGNVTALDSASISRFTLYPVEPDLATFLAIESTLNPFVKNVLQSHPECIFCKPLVAVTSDNDADDDNVSNVSLESIVGDDDEMKQFTTPRTISGVSQWLNQFDNTELQELIAITYIKDGVEKTALKETIEGHVGDTLFAAHLYAEIATNVMTINNQSSTMTIGKPQCYDQLKQMQDMQTLNEFVASMSDSDKSGSLLFALYERDDNERFINALAPTIERLSPEDTRSLMVLFGEDQLDAQNVQALLNTPTEISRKLSVIFDAV